MLIRGAQSRDSTAYAQKRERIAWITSAKRAASYWSTISRGISATFPWVTRRWLPTYWAGWLKNGAEHLARPRCVKS